MGSGYLYDLAGSGLGAMTMYNSPTYTSAGSASYLTFDGSSQYLLSPNLASLFSTVAFSYEIWIQVPTDNGCVIVENGSPTLNTNWYDTNMEIVSGEFRTGFWAGVQANLDSGAFPRSSWVQCVETYDGTTLTSYVNSSQTASTSVSRIAPYQNGLGLYLALFAGCPTNMGNGSYLAGNLGQFKVYDRALAANEVLENFSASRGRYSL
jgi:hypothetical protein